MPKDSPYKTIDDLVAAWKADPKSMAVGGGSSPGGPDHLLPMQLAQAVGIDPKEVNYVAYDGGGELLPAILGGKVAFAATGVGEFLDQVEAGEVRVLAVTSGAERVDALDAPTLEGAGHRPGLHQLARHRGASRHLRRRQGQRWSTRLTKMHDSAGVEGRADQERLDRRLPHRRRVRHLPRPSRTTAVADILTSWASA